MTQNNNSQPQEQWSSAEDAILLRYYPLEGPNCEKYLPNRNRVAVQARAMFLELTVKKSPPWSPEEVDILKTNTELTAKALQKMLPGRTRLSIIKKRQQLEARGELIILRRWSFWNQEEVAILQQYYPTEGTKCQTRIPNRSKAAIREHAKRIGLETPSRAWSQEENEILKQNSVLSVKVLQELLPARTLGAISAQKGRLGLKNEPTTPRKPPWSEQEDVILQSYYSTEGIACQKRLTNRSQHAIRQRAKLLGLIGKNTIHQWSSEENEILKNNYGLGIKALQKLLPGRTRWAIIHRKRKLQAQGELIFSIKRKHWSEEEDAILRYYYPLEGSNCKKRLPNRSKDAIRQRANNLGITDNPNIIWTKEELHIIEENCPLDAKVLQKLMQGKGNIEK